MARASGRIDHGEMVQHCCMHQLAHMAVGSVGSYAATPVFSGHDKDARRVREKLNRQRQSAAKAVISQHARMSGASAALCLAWPLCL